MSMSTAELRALYDRLSRKSNLTRHESFELSMCEAMLFNGGKIDTQRDHTPPKESKKAKLWSWF